MSARHTPGPWQQCPLDPLRIEREGRCLSGETAIALVFAPGHRPDRRAEAVPTARLIAAAPELLEALIGLRAWVAQLEDDGDLDDLKNAADDAIAKATGEEATS